jgi:hypothetical protein
MSSQSNTQTRCPSPGLSGSSYTSPNSFLHHEQHMCDSQRYTHRASGALPTPSSPTRVTASGLLYIQTMGSQRGISRRRTEPAPQAEVWEPGSWVEVHFLRAWCSGSCRSSGETSSSISRKHHSEEVGGRFECRGKGTWSCTYIRKVEKRCSARRATQKPWKSM